MSISIKKENRFPTYFSSGGGGISPPLGVPGGVFSFSIIASGGSGLTELLSMCKQSILIVAARLGSAVGEKDKKSKKGEEASLSLLAIKIRVQWQREPRQQQRFALQMLHLHGQSESRRVRGREGDR